MITGTEPSPAAVGSHFDMNTGNPTVLATANLDARTTKFMTPPGIATLARPCQSSVSEKAIAALTSFDRVCVTNLLLSSDMTSYVADAASEKQYPNAIMYDGPTNLGY
mmetsp:Transcript_24602/g.59312  ORF Transcript_24602/g.59312 Transcript_24602/m.59312 type:complete len:108 (-) Transcript_24602:253-576(-)